MRLRLQILVFAVLLGAAPNSKADPTTQATATANFAVSNTTNGITSASADASANDGVGSSSATAGVGTLGGSATVTGCGSFFMFEQVCNASTAYSQFTDTIHVSGPDPGALISVDFLWTVDGTVDGIGAYGLQARFIAGNDVVEIDSSSGGIVDTFDDVSIGGTKSLIVNVVEDSNLGIAAFMSLGVANRACWGGTDFCDASKQWSIVEDASHTAKISAVVLTPGADIDLIGASGHDYLAPASSEVPEPATISLMGLGLLGMAIAARSRRPRLPGRTGHD